MLCPNCGKTTWLDFVECPKCAYDTVAAMRGEDPTGKATAILRERAPAPADVTLATIVPYRNGAALIGYYLAVFSLVPGVGLPLGISAIVLGIVGKKRYRANPASKGRVHATTAVWVGTATSLLWGAVLVSFLLSIDYQSRWVNKISVVWAGMTEREVKDLLGSPTENIAGPFSAADLLEMSGTCVNDSNLRKSIYRKSFTERGGFKAQVTLIIFYGADNCVCYSSWKQVATSSHVSQGP